MTDQIPSQSVTHPDFMLIARAVAEGDDIADVYIDNPSAATMDAFHALYKDLVDYQSLYDASENRARGALHDIHPAMFLADPKACVAAIWSDAFLAGVRFQKLGGHTAA